MCSNAGYAMSGSSSSIVSTAVPTMNYRSEADQLFGVNGGEYERWRQSLTGEEYDAVRKYTGSWYYDINGYLRGTSSGDANIKDYVKNIDKALKNYDLKEDVTLRRGTSAKLFGGITDADEINRIFKGKKVMDKGYMSTSAVKGSNFSGDVQLEIFVHKGRGKGAWVAPMSLHSGEDEFLLARGTKMKVLGAKKIGSKTIVQVEC